MTPPDFRAAALEYEAEGFSVLPIRAGEKRPALYEWKSLQNKPWGAREINEWWVGEHANDNVGIVTGEISLLSVVDIDGEEGVKALKTAGITLPVSRTNKTPRGWHRLFAYNPSLKQGQGLLDHIDIRNDGGYIVAPPSVVDGLPYREIRKGPLTEIHDVPSQLTAVKKPEPNATPEQQPRWVADALMNGVSEPGRNAMAAQLAGYFHSRNVSSDIILVTLQHYADACSPPLDYSELQGVVTSITRYHQAALHSYVGEDVEEPLVTRSSLGVTEVFWPENGIKFVFGRIKRRSEGLSARLDIYTAAHGWIYGPVNANLLTRPAGIIKDLQGLETQNWTGLREQAFRATVQEYDRGTDFEELKPEFISTDTRYLASPLLTQGDPTMLHAEGGTGKSFFALTLARSLTSGEEIVPGIKPTRAGAVMYLDWEADRETHATRLAMIQEAQPKHPIIYRRMTGPLHEHADTLVQHIQKNNVVLIIVDSLLPALSVDANESEAARLHFEALRLMNCASLTLAHPNKEGKLFGSVFFWNLTRSVWEMRKTQQDGDNESHVGLFHRKTNNDRLHSPLGWHVVFTPESIAYKRQSVQEVPELARGTTIRAQLEHALSRGQKLTPEELAEEINAKRETVYKTLERWRDRVFGVTRLGAHTTWWLLTKDRLDSVESTVQSMGGHSLKRESVSAPVESRGKKKSVELEKEDDGW